MADDPIVTDPFDPIFNSAIRYKCPGINTRNSIVQFVHNTRCKPTVIRDEVVEQLISNQKVICRTYPAFTQTSLAKRSCTTRVALSPDDLDYFLKYRWWCNHKASVYVFSGASKVGKCNLRLRSVDMVEGKAAATCHWNKKATESRFGRKKCVRINTLTNPIAPHIVPKNLYCTKNAPFTQLGNKLCRRLNIHVRIYNMQTNITKCRLSEILDYEAFVFERVCQKIFITTNLPINFGTKMPSVGRFACRVTQVFVQTFDGKRSCNIKKLMSATQLTYRILNTNIICARSTLAEFRPGRRWRCGGGILGNAETLIFGRLWGGREVFPGPFKSSGRLWSRIRFE